MNPPLSPDYDLFSKFQPSYFLFYWSPTSRKVWGKDNKQWEDGHTDGHTNTWMDGQGPLLRTPSGKPGVEYGGWGSQRKPQIDKKDPNTNKGRIGFLDEC